jgi:O-methyltransferase involved in polyketide biosynthesis
MVPGSVFAFDACTPTMIQGDHAALWIKENIERMRAIGEPFLFGMESKEMVDWLRSFGFTQISSLQPDELEHKHFGKRTLPSDSWYTVVAIK